LVRGKGGILAHQLRVFRNGDLNQFNLGAGLSAQTQCLRLVIDEIVFQQQYQRIDDQLWLERALLANISPEVCKEQIIKIFFGEDFIQGVAFIPMRLHTHFEVERIISITCDSFIAVMIHQAAGEDHACRLVEGGDVIGKLRFLQQEKALQEVSSVNQVFAAQECIQIAFPLIRFT